MVANVRVWYEHSYIYMARESIMVGSRQCGVHTDGNCWMNWLP